ncbi:hypothetical protein I7I50_02566 [Histoplasma capsulatum G186AR]|uniref:Calcineurin-like phosphoesterase domain-containing protein n=1 Tax=Ajellomyces capsulatus TaxID=5037 RepID=A0A8H8D604_AJECA|nr:hypothetical protein I7I52_00771 [Histoplasma capsulatum]QSS71644.1 hypothetical protein I7I50_02566 [Histoplasma capsulatum G186AR]
MGIMLLDEGIHRFTLIKNAFLTVYASLFTPSAQDWGGFQYNPNTGHDFALEDSVNVVITHGPPRGVMDYTVSHQRVECPHLFTAIARSRPQMHCFGHIHEGWRAKTVIWSDNPAHFADIDLHPFVELI